MENKKEKVKKSKIPLPQNKNNFKDQAAGNVEAVVLNQNRANLFFEPVDEAILDCANCRLLNDKIFDLEVEVRVSILQRRGLVDSLQNQLEYHKTMYNNLARKHNELISYHHAFLQDLLRESREVAASHGHPIDRNRFQFNFPPPQ